MATISSNSKTKNIFSEVVSLKNKTINFLNKIRERYVYGIRWKLILAYSLISILPLLLFSNIILKSLEKKYSDSDITKYIKNANVLAVTISKGNYLFDKSEKAIAELDKEIIRNSESSRILIFDNRGMVVNDSNKRYQGKTVIVREVLEAFKKNETANIYNKDERIIYAASPIYDDASNVDGAVLIVASVEESFAFLGFINGLIVILTIFLVFVISVLVFFTSKFFLDPIKSFLEIVEKISEGNFSKRVTIKGENEFSDLADSFNHMAEKIEHSEKIRSEFVSNVSHELKTPLSSIKVLTESILLQENVPVEMYNEFLNDINSEIDRMTNIINDLLHLVKVEQTEVGINIQKTDLNKMIEEIIKRLYLIAEGKQIELRYECLKNSPAEVDEMKLSLAITNLIENGIKYTDSGGTVKVTLDSDHQNAFITIHDSGIGISEEDQSKVFTRFYRVDKTRDRETGGTGLGLAITRSTVLLHKGSIKLVSKEGEGSIFTVRIPLKYSSDKNE